MRKTLKQLNGERERFQGTKVQVIPYSAEYEAAVRKLQSEIIECHDRSVPVIAGKPITKLVSELTSELKIIKIGQDEDGWWYGYPAEAPNHEILKSKNPKITRVGWVVYFGERKYPKNTEVYNGILSDVIKIAMHDRIRDEIREKGTVDFDLWT